MKILASTLLLVSLVTVTQQQVSPGLVWRKVGGVRSAVFCPGDWRQGGVPGRGETCCIFKYLIRQYLARTST